MAGGDSGLVGWVGIGHVVAFLALASVLSACATAAPRAGSVTPAAAGKGRQARASRTSDGQAHPRGGAVGRSGSSNSSGTVADAIVAAWERSQVAFEMAFTAPRSVDATGLTPALDVSVAPGSPAFTGIASTLMTMKMNNWVGTQPPRDLGHPVVRSVRGRSAVVATCFYDTQIAVYGQSHLPVSGPLGVPDHIEVTSTMISTAIGSWLLYSTTAQVVPGCSGQGA